MQWLPPRRWFQISLRTIFVATTLTALVIGWALAPLYHLRRQQRIAAALEKGGAALSYDYDPESLTPPPGPPWVRRLFGDRLYVNITAIAASGLVDEQLNDFDALRSIRVLHIHDAAITDRGLTPLAHLTQLEQLMVPGSRMTDAGLMHLRHLRRLKSLNLDGSQLTDEGLGRLVGLTELQELSLNGTKITGRRLGRLKVLPLIGLRIAFNDIRDEYLDQLGELTALEELDLRGTKLTDAGLERFPHLPRLRRIYLSRNNISPAGVQQLRGRLPPLTAISW